MLDIAQTSNFVVKRLNSRLYPDLMLQFIRIKFCVLSTQTNIS